MEVRKWKITQCKYKTSVFVSFVLPPLENVGLLITASHIAVPWRGEGGLCVLGTPSPESYISGRFWLLLETPMLGVGVGEM